MLEPILRIRRRLKPERPSWNCWGGCQTFHPGRSQTGKKHRKLDLLEDSIPLTRTQVCSRECLENRPSAVERTLRIPERPSKHIGMYELKKKRYAGDRRELPTTQNSGSKKVYMGRIRKVSELEAPDGDEWLVDEKRLQSKVKWHGFERDED